MTQERSGLNGFLRSDATLAVITRATQGGAMGVGAVIVIWATSPVVQGYYFTFISFGILLQLCDFGLSYASLQAASRLLATGRSGELAALASRALRINAVVTVVAATVVALAGWSVFSRPEGASSIGWSAPWCAFVAAVAAHHLVAPFVFVVEGGVSVTRAWRFRLLQEVLSGCALVASLSLGAALWALVAYYAVRTVLAATWLARRPLAPHSMATSAGRPSLSLRRWRVELWPFQWRVGLGAVGNYLVFQAFGPVLFALRGPAEAGRFALSLAVMNAIVTVTTAWPVSHAGHFGVLLGRRERVDLSRRWRRLLGQSTAFATAGAASVAFAFAVIGATAPTVAARFADLGTTTLLIAAAIVHHVVACISVVVRAEGRDPMLPIGLVGGFVTLAVMTFAARRGDVTWVALGYLACTVATLPAAALVYRRFAARLNGQDAAASFL